MSALRDFEIEAIDLMCRDTLTPDQIQFLVRLESAESYEYTGCGYFLTVAHPALPNLTCTLSSPPVQGLSGEISAGFVVFLSPYKLTLECHTWGAVDVPENFRELDVKIKSPPTNYVDLAHET